MESQQDRRKNCAGQARRVGGTIEVGDQVLLNTRLLSNKAKGLGSNFVPRTDGPFVVTKRVSPTTNLIASLEDPNRNMGK